MPRWLWTEREIELVRSSRTARELAKMLGRTEKAIALKRDSLRRSPSMAASKKRSRFQVVPARARRSSPDNPLLTEASLRRGRTRRAIEDLEEALRLKREEDYMREGDW